MKRREEVIYACDFETTVYDGQTSTEVWASACVELGTEDVNLFHSIDEQFNFFTSLKKNVVGYYHNLKFDGNFWLYYLTKVKGYKQAIYQAGDSEMSLEWMRDADMPNKTFKYLISDMGSWYTMTIKVNGKYIVFKDSLKLLPFTLKYIGQSFKTKHQKLDMEYKGYRYAGCEITDDEQRYIANDVLVLKEALEFMFSEGHKKLTIGSCCLEEYENIYKYQHEANFPELSERDDAYVRKSYRGGWCYVAKGCENQVYTNGVTADVNSLYPSMMHSESGNWYPTGDPHYWTGDIPDEAIGIGKYYFVRIRCKFKLKDGYLPFIQIKGNPFYHSHDMLETSDILCPLDNKYYDQYIGLDGILHDSSVELTLTMTDYALFLEHYNVYELQVLDGCWFVAKIGIFDNYIDKYRKIKETSKGAKRQLAKLFLNNLYGKLRASDNSSFKVSYEREDGTLGFYQVFAHDKKKGYIPRGSAITSYARNFTIRTAQKNYYGEGKRGFKYADTDSIHCDLLPEELVGVPAHPTAFCHWKLESCWDEAIFVRQKTYIEHITEEDCEPVEEPYYNVKCAGMPDRCKQLFIDSLTDRVREDYDYNDREREFISQHRELTDFKTGLVIGGKLRPVRIAGGVLLMETDFTMR